MTQPVHVYGAAHSGTTIAVKLVGLHPDATYFSQYSARDGSVPGRRRVPLAHQVDRFLRRTRTHVWNKEQTRVDRYTPRPGEATQIMQYVRDAPSAEEAADRLRRLVDTECARWGRRVLFTKPLDLREHLDVIGAAHPHARLIHVVRDGRAVAASMREKHMRTGASEAVATEAAAAVWMRTLDEVEGLSISTLTVRYEDLCDDVHGTVRRMLEYSTLDPDRFPFERAPESLAVTNDRRLAQLEPSLLASVEEMLSGPLATLGYPAPAAAG